MTYNRIIPSVQDEGKYMFDIYSRLLKERIIFVQGVIESSMADDIVAQLLFLEAESEDPIHLYIDSPGGSVIAGLKVIDCMNYIKPKVGTLATGMAASMGFAILSSGERGMRMALPNAQLMAHRVSSGCRGVIQDMEVSFDHSKKLDTLLADMISNNVGMNKDKYLKLVDRDLWMTSAEAVKFGKHGVVDKVISKRP